MQIAADAHDRNWHRGETCGAAATPSGSWVLLPCLWLEHHASSDVRVRTPRSLGSNASCDAIAKINCKTGVAGPKGKPSTANDELGTSILDDGRHGELACAVEPHRVICCGGRGLRN